MTEPDVADRGVASLARALHRALDERHDRVIRGSLGVTDWAKHLAAMPEFAEAAVHVEHAGGDALDPSALVFTGVAGALAAGDADDLDTVAQQLWHYLTRPTTHHFEALALDVDRLPEGADLGGWQPWRPDEQALAAFAPVPAVAHHQDHDPWPTHVVTQHALLLRHAEELSGRGRWILVRGRRIELGAVWPLAVLNLYSQLVVRGAALFDVFQHLWILRHSDGVEGEYEPVDPQDPEGPWRFKPYTGRFQVTDDGHFRRFCTALARLDAAFSQTPSARKLHARLHRALHHYVRANADSWPDGAAEPDVAADVLLRYVICLEALLSPDDRQELSRSVAQRSAVLVEGHQEAAADVYASVRYAYRARSKHVHGDDPDDVDLPALREVVRQVVLRWLVAAVAFIDSDQRSQASANRVQAEFETVLDRMVIDPTHWSSLVGDPWRHHVEAVQG